MHAGCSAAVRVPGSRCRPGASVIPDTPSSDAVLCHQPRSRNTKKGRPQPRVPCGYATRVSSAPQASDHSTFQFAGSVVGRQPWAARTRLPVGPTRCPRSRPRGAMGGRAVSGIRPVPPGRRSAGPRSSRERVIDATDALPDGGELVHSQVRQSRVPAQRVGPYAVGGSCLPERLGVHHGSVVPVDLD